ncbi:MAG: hypothetical protein AB7S77_22560 [Desulfatirhabdiaceae bacterium]
MSTSVIRDNHSHGSVGEFLRQNITPNADISIVSAYFTIYAYHHLKSSRDSIDPSAVSVRRADFHPIHCIHARQILKILRLMCQCPETPYESCCDLFNLKNQWWIIEQLQKK